MIEDYPILRGSTWSWAAEIAGHVLRLIYSGLFDEFPAACVILGHMGEFVPFQMARLDARYRYLSPPRQLAHPPSYYVQHNLMITTSGVCSPGALVGALLSVGADRIMFAVDYPFESTKAAVDFLSTAPISELDRAKIAHGNAERLLRI